jgi:hypothetical protein
MMRELHRERLRDGAGIQRNAADIGLHRVAVRISGGALGDPARAVKAGHAAAAFDVHVGLPGSGDSPYSHRFHSKCRKSQLQVPQG